MHELGVVFNVIKRVEEVAEENDVAQVADVTIRLGEVSGVVPALAAARMRPIDAIRQE